MCKSGSLRRLTGTWRWRKIKHQTQDRDNFFSHSLLSSGDSFLAFYWPVMRSLGQRGASLCPFGVLPCARIPYSPPRCSSTRFVASFFFKVKFVEYLDKWRVQKQSCFELLMNPAMNSLFLPQNDFISCLDVISCHPSIHWLVQLYMTKVFLLRNYIAPTLVLQKGCVFTSAAMFNVPSYLYI